MYRWIDAVLVRAAAYPDADGLPPLPDVGETTDTESWRVWLKDMWSREWFADAAEVASPVLARQVDHVRDRGCTDPRAVRRVVMSMARYALRATGRATPFGLFAGIAPAAAGPRTRARWGDDHRPTLRPDGPWLATAITALEDCPELLRRVPVVANNVAFARGDRLVVPTQPHTQDATGLAEPHDVSIRHTRAVAATLRYAQSPIPLSDLATKLTADYPDTPPAAVDVMLHDLVTQRVLLTALRPPTTVTDALTHVLDQLPTTGHATDVASHVRDLRAMADDIDRHNHSADPNARRTARALVTSRTQRPPAVDLRLDADIVVSAPVLREAERAAAALTRLTPHPYGMPAWEDYHHAFLERYGPGAVVPLLEVVNPDIGLGFPATFRGSARDTAAPPSVIERDTRLLTLAHEAVLDGCPEIVLDDEALDALTAGNPIAPPPHVEVSAQVHAKSRAAVDAGDFRLVVTGASRAAGATTGRFLDLLEPRERARFTAAYASLPTLRAGARPTQLSCPPLFGRADGVARAPAVLPQVISASEHPPHGQVTVAPWDLAVTGDAHGLFLMSLADRRPVEPTAFNAVEFRHFSHPLTRFLHELPRARTAVYMPFTWGASGDLPYLPRVRHGRSILAPARWNLPATAFPDAGTSMAAWKLAFTGWRERHRLPARVLLGEADHLLPLDLDQDTHLTLLRADLDRHGHTTLREGPVADAFGWCGGRVHEVIVPLASTRPPLPSPARAPVTRVVDRADGHLPGASHWLYAKIYSHPDRHADLITRIPDLLTAWETPPSWWFVRYRDPDPHLRLRIHLPHPEDYGTAAAHVGAWAAQLRADRLTARVQFDTYYPETGRYGTGPTMTAAETVFATDSVAAFTQLRHTRRGDPHPHAVAAASLVDLATAYTGDVQDGMRWLVDHIPNRPTPHLPRQTLHKARRLADPRDHHAALRAVPGGDQILDTWARRADAIATYRSHADADGLVGDDVLASLLHVHHIRMNSLDPDDEHACHRLARTAALTWLARRNQ